jgi:hypothetical protein
MQLFLKTINMKFKIKIILKKLAKLSHLSIKLN